MNKKIIIFIILIVVILAALFFSQQAYSDAIGKTLIFGAKDQIGAYLTKGVNLLTAGVYSKVSEQVQSGGEAIQNSINQQKEKISKTISGAENYFSGIAESILHPGENNNCPPVPQTTQLTN